MTSVTGVHPILQGTDPDPDELYANFKPVRYRYVMTYLHDELEMTSSGEVLHKAGEMLAILPMTQVTYGVGMYIGTEMSGNVALTEMTLNLMPHPPLNDYERRPHPDRSGNPVGAMFECGNRGIYVMRNEQVVWGGILWTRSYSSGTPQLPVTALSFDGYVYYRLLRLTLDFRAAATNMYTIWWAVLKQTFTDFGYTGPNSGLTGRDVVTETTATPAEDAGDGGSGSGSGSGSGKHKWEPVSKSDRKCKHCGKARANENQHTNPGPNAGGGTGGGGGGGHHPPATWHPGPGSSGGGGGGHHGGGGSRSVEVQALAAPEVTPLDDEPPEPDPVAEEGSTPVFMQWTGITQLPYSNAPFIIYWHSWPHNSMDIELPDMNLKLFNQRGEMTAQRRWNGYDMPFVGQLLQEWADTETVASFEGGKRFEYKVVCWYDTVSQRFRQRYVCGEMTYPAGQDSNNPQPNGILRPLLGKNTKEMAQSPDNALVFDFPGTISSWSLNESMEEAATRYLVSDGYEEAMKHVAYGWDAELLNRPVNNGSQGWRLYDKTTSYDTTVQADVQARAERLIQLFKVPQALQIQDLVGGPTPSTTRQRTSSRSTCPGHHAVHRPEHAVPRVHPGGLGHVHDRGPVLRRQDVPGPPDHRLHGHRGARAGERLQPRVDHVGADRRHPDRALLMASFGGSLNELEARITELEKKAVIGTSGAADLSFDPESTATTTVVVDPLDWSVSDSWEPYTTVSPVVTDPSDSDYPGGKLSSRYGLPEANLIGRMCVLSGAVRRKAGSPALPAGVRQDRAMFGLPASWRPTTSMILPCLMGNTVPIDAAPSTVGIAWVEVRAGSTPDYAGGVVSYVAGTMSLSPSTGWIALQGVFPCHIIDTSSGGSIPDSWDEVHFQTTWDSLGEGVTWDNYTSTS